MDTQAKELINEICPEAINELKVSRLKDLTIGDIRPYRKKNPYENDFDKMIEELKEYRIKIKKDGLHKPN